MHPTIPTLFAALAASTCLFAQDANQDEMRRYDIRALSGALAETSRTFSFTTPPIRSGGAGEASVKYLWGETAAVEPDDDAIEKIVDFALHEEIGPENRRERVFARQGGLVVSGPRKLHERVATILAEIDRVITPTVEVELSILPPDALSAASSAVLDAAMIDRLLEVAKPLATMRTRVRPGREALFEAVGRRAYVKDYDVEVAEGAHASDPLIDVIPEGIRVSVQIDRTPGGAFLASARGQMAEPSGPQRIQMLGFESAGVLQLPRTWWTSTSASARLAERGGLLIGNDVTPRAAWLLRVLGPGIAKQSESAELRVIPVTVARRSAREDDAPSHFSPTPSGAGSPGSGAEAAEDRPRIAPELLMEAVKTLPMEGVAADRRRASRFGSHLALQGDRKFIDAAEAALGKMIDEATRAYTIEIRLGTPPAGGLVLPARDEMETLAGTLAHRAVTAAIAGDRIVMVAGEAHAYLKDRDVEIAQGMTVDDPIVDAFFTGLSLSCQVLPSAHGRCSADVRFEYQEMVELAPMMTGSKHVPEVELPRIASVVGAVPLDLALGSWALVHSAPLDGTDRQLVVMIRVLDA